MLVTNLAIGVERWGLGTYEVDELQLTCQFPQRMGFNACGRCLPAAILMGN